MLRPMALVGLLVALLLAPTSLAWEDAVDDHELGIYGGTVDGDEQIIWTSAAGTGWYRNYDLVAASLTETPDRLRFEVDRAAADPSGTEPTRPFSVDYVFNFDMHGFPMRLELTALGSSFATATYGTQGDDPRWFDQFLGGFPAVVEGTRVFAEVPKDRFHDPLYVPVHQGDVLSDVTVRSGSSFGGFMVVPVLGCPYISTDPPMAGPGICTVYSRDVVGDGALGDVVVELAPTGRGHLLLTSNRPFAVSNGLATTHLFEVELHNFDGRKDDVSLSAVQVPRGWEILHPASVSFAGEERRTIPIAVTIPFAHSHGTVQEFRLQAESTAQQGIRTDIALGLIYADPPQPAGHHDTLYFHAQGAFGGYLEMDTVDGWEEEAHDIETFRRGEAIETGPNTYICCDPAAPTVWVWQAYLRPNMQMGLDFDLQRDIEADIQMWSPFSADAQVEGILMLDAREDIELARIGPLDVRFEEGRDTIIELRGLPLPAADRIPPGSGNLRWNLQVTATPPLAHVNFDPTFQGTNDLALNTPASSLTLPLLDYHEQVDLSGFALNAFSITGDEVFTHVNPGKTAAFVLNVTNHLSQPQTVRWELSGHGSDWSTVGPSSTVVPADGMGQVVVAVTPPAGTEEGAAAELLLRGTAVEDEDRRVFARLTVLVTSAEDIPDEAELAIAAEADVERSNADLQESPGLGPILLLAALAVAVARRAV